MSKSTVTRIIESMLAKSTVTSYFISMAHDRKRHILELFNKLLRFNSIVGVFGHRQVGKSTFIASSVNEYRTLDDVDQLEAAHLDPKSYIQSPHKTPLAIDECQLEPKLFPTLKEWVRTHKKPGEFVLSGTMRELSTWK